MFNPKATDWLSLQDRLNEAVLLVSLSLSEAGFADRVEGVTSFINSGEEGVALEVLCSNLNEFEIPVPFKAYSLIEGMGLEMNEQGAGFTADLWECLKPLIVG